MHNENCIIKTESALTSASAHNAHISPHAVLKPKRKQNLSETILRSQQIHAKVVPAGGKREILKNR